MSRHLNLLKVIVRRPHRALEALFWWLTGRKVRARTRLRLVKGQSLGAYNVWMSEIELLQDVLKHAPKAMAGWQVKPAVSVLVYCGPGTTAEALAKTVASVKGQVYANADLVLVRHADTDPATLPMDFGFVDDTVDDAASGLTLALGQAKGEYFLCLTPGEELSPAALFYLVRALQGGVDPHIIYGDEDRKDETGHRHSPFFKTGWNREMVLARDYVAGVYMAPVAAARACLPLDAGVSAAAPYALLIGMLVDKSMAVRHISRVILHRPLPAGPHHPMQVVDAENQAARLKVVCRYLAKAEPGAVAEAAPFGAIHVRWPLPEKEPLVSLIVPTRDMVRLLRKCVDGLLNDTAYKNIEVLIVDNDSAKAQTHRYFERIAKDPRVRVIPYPGAFNYSAINNFAAREARGSFVGLINNDTEVMDPNWLTEMMRQAVRPHIGAVGAKLLYDDKSIQHAGVVIGIGGVAGHAHRFVRENETGYYSLPHLPQYFSAVTAACLIVDKAKFDAVGGLDEQHLAVAFNDVDFCLKLREAGWTNVYTPFAFMYHHESKSRGRDLKGEKRARYLGEVGYMKNRWQTADKPDPFYSPNLSHRQEDFSIEIG